MRRAPGIINFKRPIYQTFNNFINISTLSAFFYLFATSQTHFIFKSNFLNQTYGVAMGSNLVPVLANIFIGFYESTWLNEYNFNNLKFLLSCVDDILAVFNNEQDSLNFLNNRHSIIKFAIEKQINHFISFLYSFQVSLLKVSHLKYIGT